MLRMKDGAATQQDKDNGVAMLLRRRIQSVKIQVRHCRIMMRHATSHQRSRRARSVGVEFKSKGSNLGPITTMSGVVARDSTMDDFIGSSMPPPVAMQSIHAFDHVGAVRVMHDVVCRGMNQRKGVLRPTKRTMIGSGSGPYNNVH
jgi:hypothetical protein